VPNEEPKDARRVRFDFSELFVDPQVDFAVEGDEPAGDPTEMFAAANRLMAGIDPNLFTPVNRFHWDLDGNIIEPPLGRPLRIDHTLPWTGNALWHEPDQPVPLHMDTDWFGELPPLREE